MLVFFVYPSILKFFQSITLVFFVCPSIVVVERYLGPGSDVTYRK